jgi:hypothetical protein
MSQLIQGSTPSRTDVLCIQSAILELQNIYKPLNLEQQILQCDKLEVRGRQPAAPGKGLAQALTRVMSRRTTSPVLWWQSLATTARARCSRTS